MNTIVKVLLCLFLLLLITPVIVVVYLSFMDLSQTSTTISWYQLILNNHSFQDSFSTSILVGLIATIISVVISIIISLSYFNKQNRKFVIFFVFLLGLLPSDILALSITKISQFVGIYESTTFFLIYGLFLYVLPFNILFLWVRYFFIDNSILLSTNDLGMDSFNRYIKILFPLTKSTIFSCALLSFLLIFNEYSRTFYLSGSKEFLSEFLFGKLNSGADPSIYAASSISIFISIFCLLIFLVIIRKSATI